jgi:predicted nucleic acid-binding Zn ribbon protein
MPVYIYQGLETGNYYEFTQGYHDAPLSHHPETQEPLKRVISAPAVVFKGSGWYAKDSRSSGNRTASSSSSESTPAAKPAEASGGSSTDG